MKAWRRWWPKKRVEKTAHSKLIPMTEHQVDMSFRVYWTKIARLWEIERIQQIKLLVEQFVTQPDFEKNMIQRRYHLEQLDNQSHSGASLLALLEVLKALENYYQQNEE